MIGTMVAMAAYVTVYYRALKYRRKVWVHAGYMLSTPLILFESPFSRAAWFVFPPFQVNGPPISRTSWPRSNGRWRSSWRSSPSSGGGSATRARPFLVTAGFIVVEMLAMGFASDVELLKQFDTFIGHCPALAIVLTGFAIGAATSWADGGGQAAGHQRPTAAVLKHGGKSSLLISRPQSWPAGYRCRLNAISSASHLSGA